MVVRLGILGWKFGILNEGNVGKDGKLEKFEKFGISRLDIPKFLIWGIEKPSKLSKPARGDCRASLGLSSDDELEPSEEDGDDEDEWGDDTLTILRAGLSDHLSRAPNQGLELAASRYILNW